MNNNNHRNLLLCLQQQQRLRQQLCKQKKKTFPNTIIPPTSWFQSATIEFQERYPAAVDLDVTLEHMLGSNLETLSASQLDVIADAHVAALEEIRKHRLRLIQKRLTEQRMIDNENEETNI